MKMNIKKLGWILGVLLVLSGVNSVRAEEVVKSPSETATGQIAGDGDCTKTNDAVKKTAESGGYVYDSATQSWVIKESTSAN